MVSVDVKLLLRVLNKAKNFRTLLHGGHSKPTTKILAFIQGFGRFKVLSEPKLALPSFK